MTNHDEQFVKETISTAEFWAPRCELDVSRLENGIRMGEMDGKEERVEKFVHDLSHMWGNVLSKHNSLAHYDNRYDAVTLRFLKLQHRVKVLREQANARVQQETVAQTTSSTNAASESASRRLSGWLNKRKSNGNATSTTTPRRQWARKWENRLLALSAAGMGGLYACHQQIIDHVQAMSRGDKIALAVVVPAAILSLFGVRSSIYENFIDVDDDQSGTTVA